MNAPEMKNIEPWLSRAEESFSSSENFEALIRRAKLARAEYMANSIGGVFRYLWSWLTDISAAIRRTARLCTAARLGKAEELHAPR